MSIRLLSAAAALGLVLGACSSDDPDVTLSPVPLESPTATESASSTSVPTSLPGEPLGRAVAGATYHVVGVAHDDTLNVRSGPGVAFEVIAELDPIGSAVASGADRLLDDGLWIEVDADGAIGWVNFTFVALVGGTFDITAEVVTANDGISPSAETMEALGLLVADLRASVDPASRVEVVAAPSTDVDLGDITVDVVGLGDDAQKGERLVIFGTPDGEGFVLDAVEMTLLCDRGVDGDACV